jgi:hypothetical protein
MNRDWLQDALQTFNGGNWYGWRMHDDNGNKIPNNQRMCWEHTIVIKEGAIKPTKQELEDRIEQLKIEDEQRIIQEKARKESAIVKLKALGLTEEEVNAIIGIA